MPFVVQVEPVRLFRLHVVPVAPGRDGAGGRYGEKVENVVRRAGGGYKCFFSLQNHDLCCLPPIVLDLTSSTKVV